jgi:hypothetical protein
MSRQARHWQRFVKRRRRQLHDVWPCSMPTYRRRCPRHRIPVGPVTGICIDCHHGLYEQLAAEYAAARQEGGQAA